MLLLLPYQLYRLYVLATFFILILFQRPGPTEFSTTFVFGNEDHTLGNCLRHVLMQLPETDFCGYSVPHPYEPKMNLRLQTTRLPTIKVLHKGFTGIELLCDKLSEVFDEELAAYKAAHGSTA